MILCGNIFLDELSSTFNLKCVLCEKESKRYTDFVNHVRKKHKELEEKKTAPPPRPTIKKIKNEDDQQQPLQSEDEEKPQIEVEVEIKDEMDVDALEEFTDNIKYDEQAMESFIDPILAMEEKDSLDALEAFDSDVKDEDYAPDEPDNDDSEDEDFQMDGGEGDDDADDSDTDKTRLDVPSDKFTPTFYRKKRFVNDFIDLYKAQTPLWDINDPLHENLKVQREAEKEIITGMQKFNIYLKPSSLKSAINKVHKYCNIIKTDLENGDEKKVTSVAKAYYERCDFLKDLLEKKKLDQDDHRNNLLTFKKWNESTSIFIETYATYPLLYDANHPFYGNIEEKQKAIEEFSNVLLTQLAIDYSQDDISNGIEELQTWFYKSKRRIGKLNNKLNKDEMTFFEMCSFLPAESVKQKLFCDMCNKNFLTEHNFKLHLFRTHQIGDLPFQCNQCDKKCDSKYNLKIHVQRAHLGKQYPCEFCDRKFAIICDLKTHMLIHSAEKPHVCEQCGKSFRLKTQLGYHVTAIHTKIRAFKCTMCPKDFLKKRDLDDHIKSHLNIRDKICETCGKGFSNCHSLIRHRQIHAEVKKFVCKVCDAKFHQFVGLNGHMKRSHNIVRKDQKLFVDN